MSLTVETACPFVGIRAFSEADGNRFTGRSKQVDDVLLLLHRHRFIALTGQAGSGKSSFIASGLIPSLRKGHHGLAGKEWAICLTRPGLSPLRNLALALAENDLLNPSTRSAPEYPLLIENALRKGVSGLETIYNQSEIGGRKNLLIIIDPFEDLFLQGRKESRQKLDEERNAFIHALTAAASAEDTAVYILIVLGVESISEISPFRRLQDFLNKGQYLLPRMSGVDLRRLLTQPLAESSLSLGSGVSESLLTQFGNDMRLLPNLQFLLYQVFRKISKANPERTVIELKDLEEAGNLSHAFPQHLESRYNDLSETRRLLLEKTAKAMVSVEPVGRLTQPHTVSHLSAVCEVSPNDMAPLLLSFTGGEEGFLEILPPDSTGGSLPGTLHPESLVFLKNENLLLPWERFRNWLGSEKESRDIYRRLVADQQRYAEGKTSLLRPPDLDYIWNWFIETRPSAAWGEIVAPGFQHAIAYLQESHTAYLNEVSTRENARKEQIRRIRRNMAVGIVAGLLIIAVVSGLALKAEQDRRQAVVARNDANKAKEKAVEEQKKALVASLAESEAKKQAQAERTLALEARDAANLAKDRALEAQKAEKKATVAAENQRQVAIRAKDVADQERVKAVEARNDADKASLEASSRERFTQVKNELFVLSGQLAATDKVGPLIPRLRETAQDYNELSMKVEGSILPNNTLFQALRMAARKLEAEQGKSTRILQSGAGLRTVQEYKGTLFSAGDEGIIFGGVDMLGRISRDRIRTLLPTSSGVLAGTFSGQVIDIQQGGGNRALGSASSGTPAIALLPGGPDGSYLLATQRELAFFSREKGITARTGLRESLLSLSPLPNRNRWLLATTKGLYLWGDPAREPQSLLSYGQGAFSHPVTAVAASGQWIAFGLKNGKILVFSLAQFLENPYRPANQDFTYHRAEITKMFFYQGLLLSGSLDKSIQRVDLQLASPASHVVRLTENESWIWDITMQEDKQGAVFLISADEGGNLRRHFIEASDFLNYINKLANK